MIKKAGGCGYVAKIGCFWTVMQLVWMGLLGWGLMMGRTSVHLAMNGATAEGTVVRMLSQSDEDGTTYKPVVQYDVDGETYSITGEVSSSPPAYRAGQSVRVRYDPEDPKQARIDSLMEMWLGPGMLGGSGLFTAVLINGIMFVVVATGRRLESD